VISYFIDNKIKKNIYTNKKAYCKYPQVNLLFLKSNLGCVAKGIFGFFPFIPFSIVPALVSVISVYAWFLFG